MKERMVRHGFADRPARTVVDAVAITTAIQAQDLRQARLGVRARSVGTTDEDVTRALAQDRSVVRTWLMRGTIHLVRSSDVHWLVPLFGPMIRRRISAQRWEELGLSPHLLDRATAAAPEVLADGPLTRHEMVAGLRERGVPIEPAAGTASHLMVHLATVGMTCHADGDRFDLLERWVPAPAVVLRGDEAVAELARRYFAAFSPATPADFTAWSGLASGRAIGLIRDELAPVEVNGRPGLRLGDPTGNAGDAVRLLGGFDNLLIGYRDRALIVDETDRDRMYHGGIIRPAVLRAGRVIGRWWVRPVPSPGPRGRPVEVEVGLFADAGPAVRRRIVDEVSDVGRFLDRATAVSFV